MARRHGSHVLQLVKRSLKSITPRRVLVWREQWINGGFRRHFRGLSTEEAFTEIYRQNLWGGAEGTFCSGSGSAPEYAAVYCRTVRRFIAERRIRSVVDLGCGDFRIGSMLVSPEFQYTGVDVVADLVRRNEAQFGSPSVRFLHRDIIEGELPPGELCLIRQVLQHLSNEQILRILDNCGHYKYLIVTEHHPDPRRPATPNLDKPHGPDTRILDGSGVYLDHPPFNRAVVATLCEVESRADHGVIRTMLIDAGSPGRPAGERAPGPDDPDNVP